MSLTGINKKKTITGINKKETITGINNNCLYDDAINKKEVTKRTINKISK